MAMPLRRGRHASPKNGCVRLCWAAQFSTVILACSLLGAAAESVGAELGQLGRDVDLPDDDIAPAPVMPQPLLGLQVGTTVGASDVVHDGIVLQNFAGTGASSAEWYAGFQTGEKLRTFFLSLAPSPDSTADVAGRVQEIRISSSNPAVTTGSVSLRSVAAQSPGGIGLLDIGRSGSSKAYQEVRRLLGQGAAIGVQVSSSCHRAGRSQLRVELTLPKPAFLSPAFILEKTCHARAFTGLNVGTAPGASNVIAHGIVQWTKRRAPIARFTRSEVSLFVTLSALQDSTVRFKAPQVHVHSLSEATHRSAGRHRQGPTRILAEVTTKSGAGQQDLAAGQTEEIRVNLRCLMDTEALVEIVMTPSQPFDPYRPVSFFFKKVCRGGFRPGFSVGTAHGGADLMKDGKVQMNPMDVGSLTDHNELFFRYSPLRTPGRAAVAADVGEKADPELRCKPMSSSAGDPRNAVVATKLVVDNDRQSYHISYLCQRRGVSRCTLRLKFRFWHSAELAWHKNCGGPRPDVVVESTLAEHTRVFDGGQPAAAWAVDNPQVWLQSQENVMTFMAHQVGKSKPGLRQELELRSPKVSVSDPDILEVKLKQDVDGNPGSSAAMFARHVCKRHGTAKVTIAMMLEDGGAQLQHRVASPRRASGRFRLAHGQTDQDADHELSDPVTFSYWKVCSGPTAGHINLLQIATSWQVPEGGWRAVLYIAIGVVVLLVIYESGQQIMSHVARNVIESIGPSVLGTKIEVGHVNFRPLTGAFYMKDMVIKNPDPYEASHLMRAEKITVVVRMMQMLFTRGRVVDVRKLTLRHIDIILERNGYIAGNLNVQVILDKLESLKVEQLKYEEEERINDRTPDDILQRIEGMVHRLLGRLTMRQVDVIDINAGYQSKALDFKMHLADMQWQDLTSETGAVGMNKVGQVIMKAILSSAMASRSSRENMKALFEQFVPSDTA